MTIAVQIIAILFMLTLMFIGIWSFIIANKAYNQLKYKNYLLEKISNHLAIITEKSLDEQIIKDANLSKETENENINKDDTMFISEEEILDNIKKSEDIITSSENTKKE